MNKNKYGQILASFILEKTLGRVKTNTILKKLGLSGQIKNISPEVRYSECDITPYLQYGEYNETVAKFHHILETKLSHCNRTSFYNNIQRLIIEDRKKTEVEKKKNPKSTGAYYHDKLVLYQEDNEEEMSEEEHRFRKEIRKIVANHELIHMASTVKKENITYSGFKQIYENNKSIAHGLNEGYTERLNRRYFSRDTEIDAYSEEVFISIGIERIIGKEKMEQAYFNNDLATIIEQLAKYSSKEEAEELINSIDLCSTFSTIDRKAYYMIAGQIRVEIANIYAKMQSKLRRENQITQEEYEFNSLRNAFFVKGHILEKIPTGYGFRVKNNKQGKRIPQEVYQSLKTKFLDVGQMLPPYTLSSYESTPDDIISYTTALIARPKINQPELSAMFENKNLPKKEITVQDNYSNRRN